MRPSVVLDMKRIAVREAVGRFRTANPRVFGSVLQGTDQDGSDLDLLVDALPGATLLDLGDLEEELKSLPGVDVDLLTPGDLPAEVPGQSARGGAAGMSENHRLPGYLDHIQQAVIMSLNHRRRGRHEGDGWLRRVHPGAPRGALAQHAQHAKSHGPRLFRHQPRRGVGDNTGMAAGIARTTACRAPRCGLEMSRNRPNPQEHLPEEVLSAQVKEQMNLHL